MEYGISKKAIKEFNEDNLVSYISCDYHAAANVNYNFSPIDKILEMVEENKNLYERLLATEREKVALLEKMLDKK